MQDYKNIYSMNKLTIIIKPITFYETNLITFPKTQLKTRLGY